MARAPPTTRALRNRESKIMNVSRDDLYRLIVEEYSKEEGFELSEDRVDDLIAAIKSGKMPKDLEYDRTVPDPPEVPGGELESASDTYPMEVPHSADMSDEDIVASISQMIQGRDPESVSELFQAVFAQIPGVELGDAEEEEGPLPTLYTRGAEGRPAAGFEINELMDLIREVLEEGHYHDMGDEDEMYDALGPEAPSDYEKLMTTYHALEDAVKHYPELQSALDNVANILDGLDTGDSLGRANENLKNV